MTQVVRFHICPGCMYSFRMRLPHPLLRVAVKQSLLRRLVIVPKTKELQVIFGHALDQSVAKFSKRNDVLTNFWTCRRACHSVARALFKAALLRTTFLCSPCKILTVRTYPTCLRVAAAQCLTSARLDGPSSGPFLFPGTARPSAATLHARL